MACPNDDLFDHEWNEHVPHPGGRVCYSLKMHFLFAVAAD